MKFFSQDPPFHYSYNLKFQLNGDDAGGTEDGKCQSRLLRRKPALYFVFRITDWKKINPEIRTLIEYAEIADILIILNSENTHYFFFYPAYPTVVLLYTN